jgi:membrane protein
MIIKKIVYFFKSMIMAFYNALTIGVMKHDAIEHAGYLAYISMLALFPFLVLVMVGVGQLGEMQIGASFIQMLFENLPQQAVDALQPRIDEISKGPPQGLVTISIIGAIWTASSTLEGLRTTMNRAYHVSTPPAYIFRRLLSVVQLVILTFIIITGLTILVVMPYARELAEKWFELGHLSKQGGEVSDAIFSFSIVILYIVVCIIYYVLPNIKQRFINVAPGAALTVLLWLGAISVYSYYLSKFNQVSIIYGSLGGVIASLLFFFIVNFCLIIGAEFNYQLLKAFGYELTERERCVERMK